MRFGVPRCLSLLRRLPPARRRPTLAGELEARQAEKQAEYDACRREITLSDERKAARRRDRRRSRRTTPSITAALIQSAKTERKLGQDIEDITDQARGAEGAGRRRSALSLAARRDVLAEVLGALQRMGLNPPPAILVKPEDALSSVRSAILLGAVVPELRAARPRC